MDMNDPYHIAWVGSTAVEFIAAKLMLDTIYHDSQDAEHETGIRYVLGKIGGNRVVIASTYYAEHCQQTFNATANSILERFPLIKVFLLVGSGSGAPTRTREIQLGDVAVNFLEHTSVLLQYDFGRTISDERFYCERRSKALPTAIVSAATRLKLNIQEHGTRFHQDIDELLSRQPRLQDLLSPPTTTTSPDDLYKTEFLHLHENLSCQSYCATQPDNVIERHRRSSQDRAVHYGAVATSSTPLRNARIRDAISKEQRAIVCFDSKIAVFQEHFTQLTIRGINGYSDSHRYDAWDGYAALTASIYAKRLTLELSQVELGASPSILQVQNFSLPLILPGAPICQSFYGRLDEIAALNALLSYGAKNKTAIIHGSSGLGKSQLALRYAAQKCDDYTAIFWLNCKDEPSLQRSFKVAVQRLQQFHRPSSLFKSLLDRPTAAEIVSILLRWLDQPNNDRWLLIYDGLDLAALSEDAAPFAAQAYMSAKPQGHILITTTSSPPKDGPDIALKAIDDPKVCLQILGLQGSRLIEENVAERLLEFLGGVPLALVIAGRYLGRSRSSVGDYLDDLNDTYEQIRWKLSNSEGSSPSTEGLNRTELTIRAVSELSAQEAKRKCNKIEYHEFPAKWCLLEFWAYVSHQKLWSMLEDAGPLSMPPWVPTGPQSGARFGKVMEFFCGYGLTERRQGPWLWGLHDSVNDWLIKSIDNKRKSTIKSLITLQQSSVVKKGRSQSSSRELDKIIDFDRWGLRPEIQPVWDMSGFQYDEYEGHRNSETILRLESPGIIKNFSNSQLGSSVYANNCPVSRPNEEGLGRILIILAQHFHQRDDVHSAIVMYICALNNLEYWEISNTVDALSGLYKSKNMLIEVRNLYQRAMRIYNDNNAGDHRDAQQLTLKIADLERITGNLSDAEAIYCRALRWHQEIMSDDHIDTLEVIYKRAIVWKQLDLVEQATTDFTHVMHRYEHDLGPNHDRTLQVVKHLADIYRQQNVFRKAEAFYLRFWYGIRRNSGPENEDAITTCAKLAKLYDQEGRLHEATAMILQARNGLVIALGEKHSSTLYCSVELADVFCRQEKYSEAEDMYERVLQAIKAKRGPNTQTIVRIKNALGMIYTSWGKLEAARCILTETLKLCQNAFGDDHDTTFSVEDSLGCLYLATGELDMAEQTLERCFKGSKMTLGESSLGTLETAVNLAHVYRAQGRIDDARTVYERVLTNLRASEHDLHPLTRTVLEALSQLTDMYVKDNGSD